MKILKKTYNKMIKCANLVKKRSKLEKEIFTELNKLGIDSGYISYDDLNIIDMIQYGHTSTKVEIEEDLEKCIDKTKKQLELYGKRDTN